MNKTIEDLEEELCEYCPLTLFGEVNTNQFNLCEGCKCQEAYERYLEETNEDNE